MTENELTHTELNDIVYELEMNDFVCGLQWYGEAVKLDSEARKLIERNKTKPEKFRVTKMADQ